MKIGVVIVTFNRLDKLRKSLDLYEKQTHKPNYVVVVNNNSSDGTEEFLNKWKNEESSIQHFCIHLEENLGGSGGFHKAIEFAENLEADWVWIADDDAFPEEKSFEELVKFAEKECVKENNIVSICSANINDGEIDIFHRWRLGNPLLGRLNYPINVKEYEKEYFYLDVYSFVGAAVKKDILYKAGLPRKDFFIYGDDFEHAVRVGKLGKIVCVPSVRVHHKNNNSSIREVSWRDYYDTRNVLWITKTYFGEYAFWVRALMRLLTSLRSLNLKKVRICLAAIKDAKNKRTGKHELYRPGWTP